MYLYACRAQVKRCMMYEVINYCFLDPYKYSENVVKREFSTAIKYLSDRFRVVEHLPFMFLPYHKGSISLFKNYFISNLYNNHLINKWSYRQYLLLLIVNFPKSVVYILDPLNNDLTGPLAIQNALNM
jgi:hypothetical protein